MGVDRAVMAQIPLLHYDHLMSVSLLDLYYTVNDICCSLLSGCPDFFGQPELLPKMQQWQLGTITIGKMLGTNSVMVRHTRFGKTKDHLLTL